MAKRKVTNFRNGLEVDAQLIAPRLSTAPTENLTAGEMYYNTTLGIFYVYTGAGWTAVGGTAAGSLDAA